MEAAGTKLSNVWIAAIPGRVLVYKSRSASYPIQAFPVGASLPVTEEILGVCAKAARAGRIASLHPAGTRRGGFSAGNLLGAVDRARKVEDRIVEAGGAVVRVGELRGGGSEEPTPPGDGRLGKEFYDTNPDFGAALADQLFDASMCGVKVRGFRLRARAREAAAAPRFPLSRALEAI